VQVWRVDHGVARLEIDVPGKQVDVWGQLPVLHFADDQRLIVLEPRRRPPVRNSMLVRELDLKTGKISNLVPVSRLAKLTRSIPPVDLSLVMPRISADGSRLALRDAEGTLHLLDAATGRPLWQFAGERTEDFALSGDGSLVATIGLGPSQSPTVVILDGNSGALLEYVPFSDAVSAYWMEFSQDGALLAVCGARGVECYDTHQKIVMQELPLDGFRARYQSRRHSAFRSQLLALAPSGKALASSDGNGIYFWDLQTGERTHRIGGASRVIPAALFIVGFAVWAVAWGIANQRLRLHGVSKALATPLGLKLCWGVMVVGGLVALAIPIGIMFVVGPWIFPTLYFGLVVGVLAISRASARDTRGLDHVAAAQMANLLAADAVNPIFATLEYALLRSAEVRDYLQVVNHRTI
jgi:WD40 repeat protein